MRYLQHPIFAIFRKEFRSDGRSGLYILNLAKVRIDTLKKAPL